jgi:ribonuclease HIII
MSVYIFSGWPKNVPVEQEPAHYLQEQVTGICALETRESVSEALPDCLSRLIISDEAASLGVDSDWFGDGHIFGNGVTCALIFSVDSDPVQLSWIVTPTDSDKLSDADYKKIKSLI